MMEIIQTEILLQRIGHRIQTAVAAGGKDVLLASAVEHRDGRHDAALLLEVRFHHVQRLKEVDVVFP